MTGSDDALRAMQKILLETDDVNALRKICWDLAQEVATTRREELRLWAVIHEMQAQNTQLNTELLLERDADK